MGIRHSGELYAANCLGKCLEYFCEQNPFLQEFCPQISEAEGEKIPHYLPVMETWHKEASEQKRGNSVRRVGIC